MATPSSWWRRHRHHRAQRGRGRPARQRRTVSHLVRPGSGGRVFCDIAGVIRVQSPRRGVVGREPTQAIPISDSVASFKMFRPDGASCRTSSVPWLRRVPAPVESRDGEVDIERPRRHACDRRREYPASEEQQRSSREPSTVSTTSPSASKPRRPCATQTAARTSSWPCSPTSSGTRSHRSWCRSKSCVEQRSRRVRSAERSVAR